MQYNGGKSRQVKHISPIINSFLVNCPNYYEPFVGGMNIAPSLNTNCMMLSDGNKALVSMWNAAIHGYNFPNTVTETDYIQAFQRDDEDPLKAFILIGCSYGGIYKGGFARGVNGNYALLANKGIQRKINALAGKCNKVEHKMWDDFDARGGVIYLDPPYISSRNYPGLPNFNHSSFWEKCRILARRNMVLVSECDVPEDVEVLWERKVTRTLGDKAKVRPDAVEKLVRVHHA